MTTDVPDVVRTFEREIESSDSREVNISLRTELEEARSKVSYTDPTSPFYQSKASNISRQNIA
jgi:hypothetical protein